MKSTINSLVYNTETADEIASASGGGHCNDFHYWEETLYLTKKGNFFIHGSGGACSRYSKTCDGGNSRGRGSAIISITEAEALEWCEKHDCQQAIEKHFSRLIQEA